MGLFSYLGIRVPRPGDDSIADQALRTALAGAAYAHQTLRESLRSDPFFGTIICRALGCQDPECKGPTPILDLRSRQMPPIVDKLSEGHNPVLPKPEDPDERQ